MTAEGMYV